MREADIALARLPLRVAVPAVPIHNVEFRYRGRRFYWRKKNYFRVVRRHQFDATLVSVACERGMRLHQQETFRGFGRLDPSAVSPANDRLQAETDRGIYRTRMLVGAEGANKHRPFQVEHPGEAPSITAHRNPYPC